MKSIKFFCIGLGILISITTYPTSAQIKIHRHFSVDDGLVYSQVLQILEDHNGYLWLGTTSGLSRWDGLHFQNFRKRDGLASDDIQALAESGDGVLYIGTRSGVTIYQNHQFSKLDSINDRIHAILVAKDGKVYFATDQSGVWMLHQNQLTQFTVKNGLASNHILCIAEANDKTLYFGSPDKGVSVYRHGRFRSLPALQPADYSSIRTIYASGNGEIFCGTGGKGVVIYQAKQIKILDKSGGLPDNYINHIIEGDDNRLYIATAAGVAIYQADKIVETVDKSNGLSNNFVWFIRPGRNGVFYLGTDGGGFDIYRPHLFETFNTDTGLPHNTVWSILESKNHRFYFATDAGLAIYENGKFHTLTSQNGLANDMIISIHEAHDGAIYLGTDHAGVSILKNGVIQNLNTAKGLTSNSVWSITEDSRGKIYLGTYGGGVCVLNAAQIVDTLRLSPDENARFVTATYTGRDGSLYFGTDGCGVFKKTESDIIDLSVQTGLGEKTVWSIYEDQKGVLYFGTNAHGLFILKNGSVDTIDVRDGLSNNCVLGILEGDAGQFYLTTDNGLNVVDFTADKPPIRVITRGDGLASNECNQGAYFKDSRGNIWIGTVKGVTCYCPTSDCPNVTPPQLHISRLRVFDREIPLSQPKPSLRFKYQENYLKFDYVGIDLCAPHKVKYQYRLSSVDENWVYTSHPLVQYTNLSDGDYTFEVIAGNEWGYWSAPASVHFQIAPPFWKTWWFTLVVAVLFCLPIFIYVRARILRLLALERLRTKIAADLHDEIGAGLSEISIMSEVIPFKLPQEIHANIQPDLKKIGSVARELIHNMSDIVWLVNPKRDTLYDLIFRLGDFWEKVLTTKGIKFKTQNLDLLNRVRLPMELRQQLYLIFKEAINNSLKYSDCSEIILTAEKKSNTLILQLSDNGNGFDLSQPSSGNGLKNMQNRAQKIGGKLHIQSAPGSGTTVTFTGKFSRRRGLG